MNTPVNNETSLQRLKPGDEFSVPHQGRFKFRQIRHEKNGDIVITGVGGKAHHMEWRSFKVAGPSPQRPAKIRAHRVRKIRGN